MYNKIYSEYPSEQQIIFAEKTLGEECVAQLKQQIKETVFLSNEVLKNNMTICCINYPKGYKEKFWDALCDTVYRSDDTKSQYVQGVLDNAERFALLTYNIFECYNVEKYIDESNIIYSAMIYNIKKQRIHKDYEQGGVNEDKGPAGFLKKERIECYKKLLIKEYNNRVDSLNTDDLLAVESKKLEEINAQDF